ncbi:MAG TPA: hypothetical protein VK608_16740 [Edaphobacter sp.]|nr:hypothetical protein [Edaphobacter sp.]
MRWLLITAMMLVTATSRAQMPPQAPNDSDKGSSSSPDNLPDAPSEVQHASVVAVGQASLKASGKTAKSCGPKEAIWLIHTDVNHLNEPCLGLINPYQRFLNSDIVVPLTWQQKGYLALHNVTDPANLATIVGISGISIAADSHSAYGPGLKGFGKITGVTLLQNTTGEFFGTFLIPSLTHQDPRYYRMPNAPLPKRILYSISRSFVARHDDGTLMPNYGTLLAYPIGAELSNFYVPGIQGDSKSTVARIITGLAIDPANNLLDEFLPDVAKRVHVRIIFVQQILNNISATQGSMP